MIGLKELLQLFLIFAKIGGFTFGGGLAMLPILEREVVQKRKWASEEEMMDYYAIGQCTPGIIAVNTATFIGNKRKGILGGIVATLGVVTPSVIIISLIAAFIQNFQDVQWVQWAFSGIRPTVIALILNATIKITKKSLVDVWTVLLALAVFFLSAFTNITPALFVLGAGVLGIFLKGGNPRAAAA